MLALAILGLPGCGDDPSGPGEGSAPLPFSGSWQLMAAGGVHSCGLDTNGTAFCWGQNFSGELGDGKENPTEETPVRVSGGLRFSDLSTGYDHTCGVTTDGAAYCWGDNEYGQLGAEGDEECRFENCSHVPIPISPPAGGAVAWKTVRSGSNYTCGIATTGDLYCWGRNNEGQLGIDPRTGNTGIPQIVADFRHPNGEIYGFEGRVHQVTVDRSGSRLSHTCALFNSSNADGILACWGNNEYGQLALGYASTTFEPMPTVRYAYTAQVVVGAWVTCHTRIEDSAAYCVGSDVTNILEDDSLVPVRIPGGLQWSSLATGGKHVCGITIDGRGHCWGDAYDGKLGVGQDCILSCWSHSPLEVSGGLRFTQIAVGSDHACGVTTGGAAYCWGEGRFGKLGDQADDDNLAPQAVKDPVDL